MRVVPVLVALSMFGCGDSSGDTPLTGPDASAEDATDDASGADVGFNVDAPAMEVSTVKPTLIYANTDKELYRMDPATKDVTKIGGLSDPMGLRSPT